MGDDGIARSFVIPHAHIGIEEARENSVAVNSLFTGTKYPLLVNISEIHSITKEAREFFAVRDRDTMQQDRVHEGSLIQYLSERLAL